MEKAAIIEPDFRNNHWWMEGLIMYNRFAIEHLNQWLTKSNRKPLVIRGARQVGKTELVRLFCQQADLNLIEINLEEQQISEFEKESSFDIDRALSEIYALTGQQVTDKSLLFIDEIQESNKAYNRLRFFKEQKPNIPCYCFNFRKIRIEFFLK